MEKNKLKFNKLGKVGTIIPALLMAGMLNCTAATFHNTPNSKYTSLGNKTLVYEKTAHKYNEKKAMNTLEGVLRSDLNQMAGYDRLEAKVQEEVAGHLNDMNANSLELARMYKALENQTFLNANLTAEEMDSITANKGLKTSNQDNVKVARSSVQHFMHMVLDTQVLVRFGAEEAEITSMDEQDGRNEYFKLKVNGKRDICQESKAILDYAKNDIQAYCEYECAVNGQDGKKVAKAIANNLSKIETLVAKKNFNKNDYNELSNLIVVTADMLPEKMFGTKAMRRGLMIEFASQYSMNNMLTKLQKLGYNVQPEELAKRKPAERNFTVNPTVTSTFSNNHIGIGTGVSFTNKLKNDWSISYGNEFVANMGFAGRPNSMQLFGTLDMGKKLKNQNEFSVGVKAGAELDSRGWSVPFGVRGAYTWNINKNFGVDFGLNSTANIQRALLDVGASVGASIRTKNMVIKFSVGFGYSFDLSQDKAPVPAPEDPTVDPEDPTFEPENPEPPVYGEDEVEKQPEDEVTQKGDITELPEKDVDLDDYFNKKNHQEETTTTPDNTQGDDQSWDVNVTPENVEEDNDIANLPEKDVDLSKYF